jgi:hypothetical protein
MRSRWVDLPLAIRMVFWRIAIRSLKGRLPLSRLVHLMHTAPGSPRRRAAREARVVSISHRLCSGRLGEGSCLERSLLTYRFLAQAGADPRLVIAVRRGGKSLEWHAWVTRDRQPVHESEDSLSSYLPVVIFDARGAVEWSSSTAGSLANARF